MLLGALGGLHGHRRHRQPLARSRSVGASRRERCSRLLHALLVVSRGANQFASGLTLLLPRAGPHLAVRRRVRRPHDQPVRGVRDPGAERHPVHRPDLLRAGPAGLHQLRRGAGRSGSCCSGPESGLLIRTAGERADALVVNGYGVKRIRIAAVTAGGFLAGIGGAHLSIAYTNSWFENMVAGRGFIAVALVIFALWIPIKVMGGAYLFGAALSLGVRAAGTRRRDQPVRAARRPVRAHPRRSRRTRQAHHARPRLPSSKGVRERPTDDLGPTAAVTTAPPSSSLHHSRTVAADAGDSRRDQARQPERNTMRHSTPRLLAVAGLTAAVLAVTACSPAGTSTANVDTAAASSDAPGVDGTTIGFITVGPKDDYGYNQAVYEGIEVLAEEYPRPRDPDRRERPRGRQRRHHDGADDRPGGEDHLRHLATDISTPRSRWRRSTPTSSSSSRATRWPRTTSSPTRARTSAPSTSRCTWPASRRGRRPRPASSATSTRSRSRRRSRTSTRSSAAPQIGHPDVETITVATSSWCDPATQRDAASSLLEPGRRRAHPAPGLHQDGHRGRRGGRRVHGRLPRRRVRRSPPRAGSPAPCGTGARCTPTIVDTIARRRLHRQRVQRQLPRRLQDRHEPVHASPRTARPSPTRRSRPIDEAAGVARDSRGLAVRRPGPRPGRDREGARRATVPDYAEVDAMDYFVQGVVGNLAQ